MKARKNNYFEL